MKDQKNIACEAIEANAEALHDLSKDIWNTPELGLEERHAHDVLTDFLEKHGFQVERSYKLPTAFRATFGSAVDALPNIAVLCEYDALPDIGHACGHNLIAEAGVAAGLGIMAAMKESKTPMGKLTVIGTPAEEGYGGKIDLIEAGTFQDIDLAMMTHPFPVNDSSPSILARESLQITYIGKAAHAAGYPWEGVNAVDAAVICYQGVACLRQQMKPTWRAHCIIKEGGVKTNIIPEKAVLEIAIRAPIDRELAALKEKLIGVFEAAANATGCKMDYRSINKNYSAMIHNKPMVNLYETNLATLLPLKLPSKLMNAAGSTDMGNVAHVVPSIHPIFYIGGDAVNHTREFNIDAGHARAQPYTLIQAKTLAMTAIDIMLDRDILNNIKEAFQEDIKCA